jgi:hypothetical protein
MYKQGVIPEQVFSLQIGDENEQSIVTIGGYNTTRFAKEELVWHNLTNKFWWTLKLDSVSLSGKDLGISTSKVVIDTGTSFTLMPTSKNKPY